MNEKSAWQQFVTTGSVSAYLSYTQARDKELAATNAKGEATTDAHHHNGHHPSGESTR